MMDEAILRLEEKIAYLERHVTEQDKAMLEMAEEIRALRRELKRVVDKADVANPGDPAAEASPASERPPHY